MIKEIKLLTDIKEILKFFTPYLDSMRTGEVNLDVISMKYYENAVFLTYINQDKIMGMISFYCNDKINKMAFVSNIVVLPEYRRMGIGKELMNEAFIRSKIAGMKTLELEVNKKDFWAISFYNKLGLIKTKKESDRSYYMMKKL